MVLYKPPNMVDETAALTQPFQYRPHIGNYKTTVNELLVFQHNQTQIVLGCRKWENAWEGLRLGRSHRQSWCLLHGCPQRLCDAMSGSHVYLPQQPLRFLLFPVHSQIRMCGIDMTLDDMQETGDNIR